jgi:CheY-like chemotaxis protein
MADAGPGRATDEKTERTVLIVDDEAQTRTLLRTVLRGVSVPCQVYEAVDGDAALELARRRRPDLVLLDIVLPGSSVSGVLACRELAKDLSTKVVVVSGKAGESIVRACLHTGAYAYVRKPFSVDDMRSKIEGWLAA